MDKEKQELLNIIEDLKRIIAEQAEIIIKQAAKIKEQEERIKELESQVAKNDKNSHSPPSQNRLKRGKKGKKDTKKKKSDKKAGGQKGHQGKTKEVETQVDEQIVHEPEICSCCFHNLKEEDLQEISKNFRQEITVKIERHVINHHLGEKICPHCQTTTQGAYPEHIKNHVQYGRYLQLLSGYLSGYQLIPYKRLQELFSDLFQIKLSQGTLCRFNQIVADSTDETLDNVVKTLLKSKLMHVDESGFYLNGNTHWLYTFCTPKVTYLEQRKGRSYKDLNDIGILQQYYGALMSDFYALYRKYDHLQNFFCNAHLLRELNFLADFEKKGWAKEMISLLLHLKECSEKRGFFYPVKRAITSLKYDQLVFRGLKEEKPFLEKIPKPKRGRKKQTDAKNILDRLKEYKKSILGFAYHDHIPFTNNQAERDIRFIKVKQKISGTFRSKDGADNFLKIASVISTFKKQKLPVLASLNQMMMGQKIAFKT